MGNDRAREGRLCMLLAARAYGIANELARLSDAECELIAQEADNLLSLSELLILAARKPASD